ncbi:MAG: NAD(P)H-hydrate dehydratase [Lachnospiraceae bacterium]|nr:NAD(P)H-hydrate dehydratase [Lachnospiraceae bacterium]
MKCIVDREQMAQIDEYSIKAVGIPSMVLMERAAFSVLEQIRNRFKADMSVLIVVESGNNGADGLALARMLFLEKIQVEVYYIHGLTKESNEFMLQSHVLKNMGVEIKEELDTKKSYDMIIDGIFGNGLSKPVRGIHESVLEKINHMPGDKIAIDMPTGVDASTGKILGTCFKADLTVTFGYYKIGQLLYPGRQHCGEVVVTQIGFAPRAVSFLEKKAFMYEESDLQRLPKRRPDGNKGSFGKVAVIAGSKDMAGAVYFSAHSAYVTGAGLVKVFTHENNKGMLQSNIPEVLIETYSDEMEENHFTGLGEKIKNIYDWADAVILGPGLGKNKISYEIVHACMNNITKPTVIDADAINILSEFPMWIPAGKPMIFTPHLMELSRISGITLEQIKEDIISVARQMAEKYSCVFICKDASTVVADYENQTYINVSGNHGMATGGSGDVLTGILGGLLAQGMDRKEAAGLGVYLHGLAGDEAVKNVGFYGLIARDLIQYIPKVMMKC